MAEWKDSFVGRLLREDVPQRVVYGDGRVWVYRDSDGRLAGLGTLDVCEEYCNGTARHPHPYIPLLAVNPSLMNRGYGTSILRHLVGEAALRALLLGCQDILYLDVYATSTTAIRMYESNGFVKLSDMPTMDPVEGKPYFIMSRRVTIASRQKPRHDRGLATAHENAAGW